VESVQYIDSIGQLCHIDNPPLAEHLDPNFANAGPNRIHGLPIGWFQPALNGIQLKSCLLSRFGRKSPQFVKTGADES